MVQNACSRLRTRALFFEQTIQGHAAGSLVQKNTIDIQQRLTL
jgi:hypothetical protein